MHHSLHPGHSTPTTDGPCQLLACTKDTASPKRFLCPFKGTPLNRITTVTSLASSWDLHLINQIPGSPGAWTDCTPARRPESTGRPRCPRGQGLPGPAGAHRARDAASAKQPLPRPTRPPQTRQAALLLPTPSPPGRNSRARPGPARRPGPEGKAARPGDPYLHPPPRRRMPAAPSAPRRRRSRGGPAR